MSLKFQRQSYEDISIVEATEIYDCVQLKYDGIWAQVVIEPTCTSRNKAMFYSRDGNYKFQRLTTIPCGIYLGEFMFQSQWAQQVDIREKCFLFDVLEFEGEELIELPYRERYRQLKIAQNKEWWFPLVQNYSIADAYQLWDQFVATRKFEGLVFRKTADDYLNGKLGRVKIDVSGDFYIVNFYEGDGRLKNNLGAVGVSNSKYGTEVMRVGGGFSDKLRQEIWNNQVMYKHKCIEVTGKAKFDSGCLRHPNFSCFRTDK